MAKKFSFGGIKTTTPKKHLNKKTVNEVLFQSQTYDPSVPHLIFVTEIPELNKLKLRSLDIWIKKHTGLPFIVISATDLVVPAETLTKDGVDAFYKANHSKFADHINENSIVMPMGRSIMAVTGDSNVYTSCFTDHLCNETRFYCKRHNCYVYPIFGLDNIIIMDQYNMFRPRRWSKTNFSAYQVEKATREKLINCCHPREPKLIRFHTVKEVSAFLQKHMGKEELLSWDLETSGLDFRTDIIGCITMSFDGRTGYFIPWKLIKMEELNQFFIGKKGIGSNIKFDIRMARKYGITNATAFFDTHNCGHIINENRNNGMKSLAYHYTMFGGYDEALDYVLSTMKEKNFLEVPEPILFQYATMDAIIGFQLYEAMNKQLDVIDAMFPNPYYPDWTLRRYFEEIIMPWVGESAEIELEGIYINEQRLEENSRVMKEKILNIKKEIALTLNCSIDVLTSTEKLGKILERKGWTDFGRAKKGHYLTNDVCLESWSKQGHPEAKLLQRMRSLETLYGTFIGSKKERNGWYQYIIDGKVNPEYQAMLADSHRNKCRNPNWQNLAVHDKEAKLVTTNVGLPGNNFKFLTLDYKALQIKLCAIESKDPVLTDIYINNRSGGDLHSITGYNIFCTGKEFDVQVIKFTCEDGTEKSIYGYQKLTVNRGGEDVNIRGWELQKGDELSEDFIKNLTY